MSTAASRRLTFLAGLRCHTGVPRCVGRLAAACEDVATALELEVAETTDAVSRTLVAGSRAGFSQDPSETLADRRRPERGCEGRSRQHGDRSGAFRPFCKQEFDFDIMMITAIMSCRTNTATPSVARHLFLPTA